MRGAPGNASKNLLFIVDIFLILSAINLAVTLRLGKVVVLTYYTGATVFVTFSYLLCFYVFDLYNLKAKTYDAPGLTRYLVAVFSGTGIAAVIFYSFSHWKFGRGIVILTAFFVFVLTYLWRLIFEYFFVSKEKKKKVIIAGAGSSGRAMYNILKENELCDIKGFVDDAPDNKNKEIGKCGVIGGSEMISRLAGRNEIDMVVVAITHEKKKKLISALLEAKLKGVGVYDMQIMYEKITGKLPVNHLREGWLAYSELRGAEEGVYKVKIKRLVSILVAFSIFLLTLPVMLFTAVLIRIETKGPIFFRQKRVGLNGSVFEIVKFRSMVQNAETGEAIWAVENDSRVTRVGKIIRKLRIDELPQLWNIIKGDMSLVGPRPERPEFIEELNRVIPFYFIRHVVKPGITGWAQVNFKYGASKEDALEKLQYDLYYVKNLSFFLDARIILKTIRVVLFGTGAR